MVKRVAAIAVVLAPALSSAEAPAADFAGELRSDLPIAGWFDDARTRGFLRVGDFTSKIYRAWKVALADLDGDGTREVVLGIWSNEPRHDEPQPHRTVWILRWDADRGQLVEAWRGSALARPLRDFEINADQLVASERVGERCFETTYAWTGFGFRGTNSSPVECE